MLKLLAKFATAAFLFVWSCNPTPPANTSTISTAPSAWTALDSLSAVGVTFGGVGGWGHGLYVTNGTAQIQLLTYTIQ